MSETWAVLKDETPFNHLFPDGRVPICSPLPIIPREQGAPLCYLVPGHNLTEPQLRGLAEMLYQQWQPECESLDQAIAYIRDDAMPIKVDWFTGVASTNIGLMLSMAEMGDEDDDYCTYCSGSGYLEEALGDCPYCGGLGY